MLERPGRWAAAALALLVAVLLVCEVIGWPFLRGPLQHRIEAVTGAPAIVEGGFAMRLLWRPHLAVGHLRIGPGGGIRAPYLVDAHDLDLHWRWVDVWRWQHGQGLRVQSLRATAIDGYLIRDLQGRASWQLGGAAPVPPEPSASATASIPRFGNLALGSGHVLFEDAILDSRLDIEVHGDAGGPADRKAGDPADERASGSAGQGAAGGASGKGGAAIRADLAGYRARVEGRWKALPLQLQIHAGGSLPMLEEIAAGAATPLPLRVEGQAGAASIFFDGQAAALLGNARMDGAVRLRGPSLASVGAPLGVTLPGTPPFDLVGHLSRSPGVWQLRVDRMSIGGSRLDGDFRYDMRPVPPLLSGRLGGTRLALADLGPAVGAASPASGAASGAEPGRVLPRREFDLPSLRAMDADVQIAIDQLDLGSTAIAPLQQLRTHLLLQAGVLHLKALQAGVAGGWIRGQSSLDGNAPLARWDIDLQLAQIDLAGWVRGVRTSAGQASAPSAGNGRALKAERDQAHAGGAQPVEAYVTGALGGHLQARGQGRSTGQILASLDGQAQLALTDASLSHLLTEAAGLDLAEALGVWVRGDRPLPLRCARFDLVARDGVVRPTLAVLDNSDSTLRVFGSVDLRQETLALKAVVHPKDRSPLTLRAPILVGGTLGDPSVSLQGRPLVGKVLGAAALGALLAPVAALLPLVDLGQPEKTDPCAAAPATASPAQAAASAQAASAARPSLDAARVKAAR